MLTINVSQRANFFDRKKVADAIGRANANALGKGGSFIRQRARSSMRRRKKPSAPGTPPSAHAKGFASLKTILFAFDFKRQSVVVGPVRLNQHNVANGVLVQGTVPAVHEFGGTIGFREKKVGRHWTPVGRRRPRPGQPVRVRWAKYPMRPFMGPALKHASKELPGMWRGTLRG